MPTTEPQDRSAAHPGAHCPRSLRLECARTPVAMAMSGMALGLSAAMLMPLQARAQAAAPAKAEPPRQADAVQQLPEVKTRATAIDPNPNAETGVPYKAKTSGDSRHTRPLAETPATIQVVTKKAIDDSGVTDLKDILAAQPGITLGTGENGNQFGDRYVIRGQEARSDVFVDGLRDPGMTIRESFAVEQVEISKGPNSSFAGRGTAGGAVNAITKQATLDYDFTRASLGAGTDKYFRGTLDMNKGFSDQFALRANVLYGTEDVPDRAPADRERKGLALSGLFEATKDLDITLDYYGLRAHDKPDLGSFFLGAAPSRQVASGVPSYVQDEDFLKSDVDTGTLRLRWKFGDAMRLTSLTRYGKIDNGYITTNAGRPTTAYLGTGTGSPYSTSTLSSHNGWQEVTYFAHQTSVQIDTPIAGNRNEFIVTGEYTDHKVLKGAWTITNTGTANCRTGTTATTNNAFCITDSTGATVANVNSLYQRQFSKGNWNADWHVKTLALSAMDTMDLSERFTLFAGLRADHFKFKLDTATTNANTGVLTPTYYPSYSDTLVNGHLGLTYKIAPAGIVYVSAANAADINGGESDVGTNSGYGGAVVYNGSIAGAKPEKSTNFEIGTKWDLLDGKLLATAAVFRTDKRDVMEGANYDSVGTFNSGKNRVHGLELGLVGNVTPELTVQAGLALMKSRITASQATATVNGVVTDIGQFYVGKPLSNFADKTASLQAKYQLTEALGLGGGVRYVSDRHAGQPDTACALTANTAAGVCSWTVPSYTVFDVFATYHVNRNLELRLNVLNAGDKDYYTAGYRAGFMVYKGDARAVRLTADLSF